MTTTTTTTSSLATPRNGNLLRRVIRAMEKIAPLSLADARWDNVGLLAEAPAPRAAAAVFLAVDLSQAAVDEALACPSVGVVVAYHPPLFRPFRRLVASDDRTLAALRCVAAGVSIYSPHTALDACVGGINDWLARGCGPGRAAPITPAENPPPGHDAAGAGRLLALDAPVPLAELVRRIKAHLGLKYLRLARAVDRNDLASPSSLISSSPSTPQVPTSPSIAIPSSSSFSSSSPPSPAVASQPSPTIPPHPSAQQQQQPSSLASLASAAIPSDPHERLISTIAICAGSGASVLAGVRADAYLTGEMSHHEILAAVAAGTNVILTEHSNSERGYLSQVLRPRLLSLLKVDHGLDVEADVNIDVIVSQRDQEPLTIV